MMMDDVSATEMYLIEELRRACQGGSYGEECYVPYPLIYSPNYVSVPLSLKYGVDYNCVGDGKSFSVSSGYERVLRICDYCCFILACSFSLMPIYHLPWWLLVFGRGALIVKSRLFYSLVQVLYPIV